MDMAARLLSNIVIGGGPVDGTFNAPVGQLQTFDVPVGTNVTTCWYVPIDNLPDFTGFDQISVAPSGNAENVSLSIKPNRNALLRILLYGE
jgi:hypothetical protein